jgi:methionyl-tRNA formyltransferase
VSAYPYARGDRLVERNDYSYAAFGGEAFLSAWRAERARAAAGLADCGTAATAAPPVRDGGTAALLERLHRELRTGSPSPAFHALVQRFEVTKRLHRAYDGRWRAEDRTLFHDLGLYLRFAELLDEAYRATGELPYLSTLLKCVDTLCAVRRRLTPPDQARLARLIAAERRHVENLPRPARPDPAPSPARARHEGGALPGSTLLVAPTPRSIAYAAALAARGLRPERVIVLGASRPAAAPLCATCERPGWAVERLEAEHVDDPAVVDRLRALRPRLVVYSGFGGQLVGADALETADTFLHAHSGWLPHERGSTTLYYSLLRDGDCSVSVLRLTAGIDAGPVLARRRYPAPAPGSDVDGAYDAAIRADLLIRVLEGYVSTGRLPEPLPEEPSTAPMHYVIHPVLKHVALLRLRAAAPSHPRLAHALQS